jgi:hypothetical protein
MVLTGFIMPMIYRKCSMKFSTKKDSHLTEIPGEHSSKFGIKGKTTVFYSQSLPEQAEPIQKYLKGPSQSENGLFEE